VKLSLNNLIYIFNRVREHVSLNPMALNDINDDGGRTQNDNSAVVWLFLSIE
jgi:hypothetical protein